MPKEEKNRIYILTDNGHTRISHGRKVGFPEGGVIKKGEIYFAFKTDEGLIFATKDAIFEKDYSLKENPFSNDTFSDLTFTGKIDQPKAFQIWKN